MTPHIKKENALSYQDSFERLKILEDQCLKVFGQNINNSDYLIFRQDMLRAYGYNREEWLNQLINNSNKHHNVENNNLRSLAIDGYLRLGKISQESLTLKKLIELINEKISSHNERGELRYINVPINSLQCALKEVIAKQVFGMFIFSRIFL